MTERYQITWNIYHGIISTLFICEIKKNNIL